VLELEALPLDHVGDRHPPSLAEAVA
jgi:hypothetical protein